MQIDDHAAAEQSSCDAAGTASPALLRKRQYTSNAERHLAIGRLEQAIAHKENEYRETSELAAQLERDKDDPVKCKHAHEHTVALLADIAALKEQLSVLREKDRRHERYLRSLQQRASQDAVVVSATEALESVAVAAAEAAAATVHAAEDDGTDVGGGINVADTVAGGVDLSHELHAVVAHHHAHHAHHALHHSAPVHVHDGSEDVHADLHPEGHHLRPQHGEDDDDDGFAAGEADLATAAAAVSAVVSAASSAGLHLPGSEY